MQDPAAIASWPWPERHGPGSTCVLAERSARRRRGCERRGVDPDTLETRSRLAISISRSIEEACQRSMSGQPPDPDWASRLVQGLLVPPLPQNYRKSLRP